MVLGKKSKFARSFGKRVVAVGFAFSFLAGTAMAQLPEPPAQSDIALRILPMPDYASAVEPDSLRRHPVYRLIGKLGKEYFDFEPFQFFEDAFEGTAVAAVLSKPGAGGGSSLKAFFEDRKYRDRWVSDVGELTSLANDLELHYQDTEQYPSDLQAYLDEVRYYEPYLSSGVSYRYEVLNDGKDYRLTMVFSGESKQSKLGQAPVYSSRDGRKNLLPTAKPLPLNLVLGAKIKDKTQLQNFLNRAAGPAQGGFWRVADDAGMPLIITIRGDWLVASDQMSNLGEFLKSLNREKPGWSSNSAFKKVARNLKADAPILFFVDTPKLLRDLDFSASEEGATLASLVGPIGYALTPLPESQLRIEAFIGVEAPKGSKLEQFFSSSAGQSPVQAIASSNIPWDVGNVFAFDSGNCVELLDSVLALFPDAEAQFGMAQDIFFGMLGLEAEAGLAGLAQGPVIVSYETIDVFTNSVETFAFAKPSAYDDKEELSTEGAEASSEQPFGDESDESGEDSELNESAEFSETTDATDEEPSFTEIPEEQDSREKGSPIAALAQLPATFAFQVPLESNRQAMLDLLNRYMEGMSSETLYGVELKTSADGLLSYALDDKWLYVSGGRTDRLIQYMLEASHGRKESLATIDSWTSFSLAARGRLIGFGHQKVDAFHSVLKGFLIFMGSEFRPLANEMGKLRDYHSVMTVVPDGFMAVGEMVQGDER